MEKAFITGITGQDGIHLANFLTEKGYEVYGLIRQKNSYDERILAAFRKTSLNKAFLYKGDLQKDTCVESIIKELRPNEIYNLGAISNIDVAEKKPVEAYNTNFLGTLRILEAIRIYSPKTKLFQAGSIVQFFVQNESKNDNGLQHHFEVYGTSKKLAYKLIKEYRERHNLYVCCGFMAGHESFLRDGDALSKTIVRNVVQCWRGEIDHFCLYNIDCYRDWGHAKDFVRAMWLMLQGDTAKDFTIASGNIYTIKDFCTEAFSLLGININWNEDQCCAKNKLTGKILVKVDNSSYKKWEYPVFDKKIEDELKWFPEIGFKEIIKEMIEEEVAHN